MSGGIVTGNKLVKIKTSLPGCLIEFSPENCLKVILTMTMILEIYGVCIFPIS